MGAALSKSEGCMAALCGRKDDAYVGSECPLEDVIVVRMNDRKRPVSLPIIKPQTEDIGRRIELEASALGFNGLAAP